MSSLYSHVRSAVAAVPWLIVPQVLDVVVEVLARRAAGVRLSDEDIADRIASEGRQAGPRKGTSRAGAVAVIPVYGILAHRAEFFADTSSSGTSVHSVQRAFREAMADPEVASILLDIDSPGGQAAGIPELAAEIRASRGQKPIAALANTLMASAAYYLGSQADELIASPSSLTGSVGVVMAHVDETAANEKEGLKVTLVSAGAHKVETYPESVLSDDARAHMQGLVDDMYGQFISDVAKGRGVSVAKVKADFGQGRVLTAREAVKAGMVDRVGTYEDTIVRLAQGKVAARGVAASTDLARYAELVAERERLLAAGVSPELLAEPAVPIDALDWAGVAVDDDASTASGEEALDEVALERAIASRRR